MTRSTKIAAAVFGGSVVFFVYRVYSVRREIERVRIEAAEEIISMARAAAKVHDRIVRGEYSGKEFADVLSDYEFEKIASREEQT